MFFLFRNCPTSNPSSHCCTIQLHKCALGARLGILKPPSRSQKLAFSGQSWRDTGVPRDPPLVVCGAGPHTWVATVGASPAPRRGPDQEPLATILIDHRAAAVALARIGGGTVVVAIRADHVISDGARPVGVSALSIGLDVHTSLLEEPGPASAGGQGSPACNPGPPARSRLRSGQASCAHTPTEGERRIHPQEHQVIALGGRRAVGWVLDIPDDAASLAILCSRPVVETSISCSGRSAVSCRHKPLRRDDRRSAPAEMDLPRPCAHRSCTTIDDLDACIVSHGVGPSRPPPACCCRLLHAALLGDTSTRRAAEEQCQGAQAPRDSHHDSKRSKVEEQVFDQVDFT